MNYRVERRKSPANFSFERPSIFHRVASLLTLTRPPVPTKRAIATINYTVYFGIKRASSICGAGCDLGP